MNTFVYVDGFNFYYGAVKATLYKWLNLLKKCQLPLPSGKERITIRLDADILDWFRQRVNVQGGGNYQTMINQVLRDYIYSHHQPPLEDLLRRVVREELAQYRAEEP